MGDTVEIALPIVAGIIWIGAGLAIFPPSSSPTAGFLFIIGSGMAITALVRRLMRS